VRDLEAQLGGSATYGREAHLRILSHAQGQLVLINGNGKHQQPGSDQVMAPPAYTGR